jgi:branched-chain amino acid transport system substrate-binding protein
VQNVALIHQGDDWSRALSDIAAEELPKSGFNIVSTQVLPEGEIAVASTIATAIIASGADFVYWCGYHTDGGPMIRQLRQEGFTGHIAVGDGSASSELITAAGDFGEGVFVTSPPFARFSGPRGEAFDAAYRARFGIPPEIYATVSYDTIYLLKAAIEKAGSIEMEKVRDALNEIEFEGVSNTIRFTADREPDNSNFIIIQIAGDDFRLVPVN